MRPASTLVLLALVIGASSLAAAPRQHVIVFGKSMPVKWFVSPQQTLDMTIRSLLVDGKLREFTTGDAHDVTDRTFVVRRVFRVNDSLPEEADRKHPPRWKWQRGGWLQVDRQTGRIATVSLPDFDPFYSAASWYRDYVAYCGVTDNGERAYAMVAQLGRKKPLLRKDLGAARQGDTPDSECPPPHWHRDPTRVSFAPPGASPFEFEIKGTAAFARETEEGESQE